MHARLVRDVLVLPRILRLTALTLRSRRLQVRQPGNWQRSLLSLNNMLPNDLKGHPRWLNTFVASLLRGFIAARRGTFRLFHYPQAGRSRDRRGVLRRTTFSIEDETLQRHGHRGFRGLCGVLARR